MCGNCEITSICLFFIVIMLFLYYNIIDIWGDEMNDILDFIHEHTSFKPNDYVVIGLSGGPDSMVLLDHLLKIRDEYKINIVCAHVHHNLREESDNEAILVKNYCLDHGVIFEMTKLEKVDKFTESYGHEMRYAFFEKIINKYQAKYLFTAHHGDDLIETILMRLVRGSTLRGYAGFKSVIRRKNYTILRPLIYYSKEEILEYAKKNNIPFALDYSNNSTVYTRNRYRKYVLPMLKEEDSNVHLKFLRYSELLNDCNDYIEKQIDKVYDVIVNNTIINLDLLKKEHKVIINGIINRWLHKEYGNDINLVTKQHTDSILRLIYSSKPNVLVHIPNYRVVKAYNRMYLEKNIEKNNYEYQLDNIVKLPNGHTINIVDYSDKTSNYVTYLSSEDIKLPLYVRNYHNGDKMTVKNMEGHKKISSIFINEKIDLNIRNEYPVVLDSTGEIIWLPGIKKSSFDRQKSGKYDIILEYR